MKVKLDERDRILIQLVDKAQRTGVGRSFEWRGHRVKVLDINDKTVRISAGAYGEELEIPRNTREIAVKAAMLMGRFE